MGRSLVLCLEAIPFTSTAALDNCDRHSFADVESFRDLVMGQKVELRGLCCLFGMGITALVASDAAWKTDASTGESLS